MVFTSSFHEIDIIWIIFAIIYVRNVNIDDCSWWLYYDWLLWLHLHHQNWQRCTSCYQIGLSDKLWINSALDNWSCNSSSILLNWCMLLFPINFVCTIIFPFSWCFAIILFLTFHRCLTFCLFFMLFSYFVIFQDVECIVRETGLKEYSDWPTYPQLYHNGELLGGLDIVQELQESGELQETLTAS